MPRILLTRPQDRSEALAKDLADDGWTAVIWPLLTIQPLLSAPIDPPPGTCLIFTSARGVDALPDPVPAGAPAYCVGPATAAAARARGFADIADAGGDVDDLTQMILAAPHRNFLHLRAADARGDICARLTAAGITANEIIAYKAKAADAAPPDVDTAIKSGNVDAIALFSPRTADIFVKRAHPDWAPRYGDMTVFAISQAAAAPISDMGFGKVVIAPAPNGPAMRAAICGAAKKPLSPFGLHRRLE